MRPCLAVKVTLISLFLLPEKDAIPIQSRQNFCELVQLESIIFKIFFSNSKVYFISLPSVNPLFV